MGAKERLLVPRAFLRARLYDKRVVALRAVRSRKLDKLTSISIKSGAFGGN